MGVAESPNPATGSNWLHWRTRYSHSTRSSARSPLPELKSRPASPRTPRCPVPRPPTKGCESISTFSLLQTLVSSPERRTELYLVQTMMHADGRSCQCAFYDYSHENLYRGMPAGGGVCDVLTETAGC